MLCLSAADHHSSSGSHHKKKKRSLLTLSAPADSPQTAVTAMGLLQAITSPTAEAPYPSKHPRDASSSRKRPQVVPVVGEEVELEGEETLTTSGATLTFDFIRRLDNILLCVIVRVSYRNTQAHFTRVNELSFTVLESIQ